MNDPKWQNWKDHSNNQAEGSGEFGGGGSGMDKSMFEYHDSTEENIHKPSQFPEVKDMEYPSKM